MKLARSQVVVQVSGWIPQALGWAAVALCLLFFHAESAWSASSGGIRSGMQTKDALLRRTPEAINCPIAAAAVASARSFGGYYAPQTSRPATKATQSRSAQ